MLKKLTVYPIDKNKLTFTSSIPSKVQSHIVFYIFKTKDENPNIENPDMILDLLLKNYVKPNYNMSDLLLGFCRDTIQSQTI